MTHQKDKKCEGCGKQKYWEEGKVKGYCDDCLSSEFEWRFA